MDLHALHRAVPRYTSYPTAPQFKPIEESLVRTLYRAQEGPLSLYVHVPFCKTMCLFCACSVTLNRNPQKQADYVADLIAEIQLHEKRQVTQLHFGGGTPTLLTEPQLEIVMAALRKQFDIAGELSIEVDPRTVVEDGGVKLRHLRELGFNRISLGVQDLDPNVQKAVRRYQSEETTVETLMRARELGFEGINVDLIYGLPLQTRESFARTARRMAELKPDRIALFSYAQVPWLKPHQKAIDPQTLPSAEEKLALYKTARACFLNSGYGAIGMDHFALHTDSLMQGLRAGTLQRNFQGYSLRLADDMIGLGVTSIGAVGGAYVQNIKDLGRYSEAVRKGRLPVEKGLLLSAEDLLRRQIIQEWMCRFAIDERRYPFSFETRFARELELLRSQGLVEPDRLAATEWGALFIRLIASAFDAYLQEGEGLYSRSI